MLFQPLQLLGLVAIFGSSTYLIKPFFENEYLKIFFFLFSFWAIIILLRGVSFNKDVLKLIFLNPWFGGMFYLVPRSVVEYFTKSLGVRAIFILFTHMYHSKSKNLIAIVTVLVVLVLGVIRARRGVLFMGVLGLLFAGYLYFIRDRKSVV